jgi:hypothetical protein
VIADSADALAQAIREKAAAGRLTLEQVTEQYRTGRSALDILAEEASDD